MTKSIKTDLILLNVIFGLFLFCGSALACFGQADQIVGGYGDADVKDKEVIKAANFAVKQGAKKSKATVKLVSIQKAQMQVVAGLNYDLCLQITTQKAGKKAVKQFVKTVVYQDLKNVLSLTSWTVSKTPCVP